MDFTERLAGRYAEGARRNYEECGDLVPIVAFYGEQAPVICVIAPTDDVPAAMAMTTGLVGSVLRPDIVVTVAETWRQVVHADEGEVIQRGDLAKKAEAGDPTVHTTLMTIAWSRITARCHAVLDAVVGPKVYERDESHGAQDGAMAEMMLDALDRAANNRPPPEIDREVVLSLVQEMGLVAAAVTEPPASGNT